MCLIATQAVSGRYEERCTIVSIPYEERAGGSVEGAVVGGLVGGVLGKAVTDDDKGAVAGALLGGVIGSKQGNRTVTRYRDEDRCQMVFVPEQITDIAYLMTQIDRLNARAGVTVEDTKDVQFTVGTVADGQWGPNSRRAAEAYLDSLR